MDSTRMLSRRFKRVTFNAHVPWWIFAKATEVFPEDAFIIAVDRDVMGMTNSLVIWSSEFEEVHESMEVPQLILETNIETKEVSVMEVAKDGSWKYWKPRAKGDKACGKDS